MNLNPADTACLVHLCLSTCPPSTQFSFRPYFPVVQLLKNRWVALCSTTKVLFSFCKSSLFPWGHRVSTPHPTWLSSTRLCHHLLSCHLLISVARLFIYRLAARIITWIDRLQSACPWLFRIPTFAFPYSHPLSLLALTDLSILTSFFFSFLTNIA